MNCPIMETDHGLLWPKQSGALFFFKKKKPEGILVSIASIPQGEAFTLAQKKFAAKINYCPATGLSFRC